MNFISGLTDFVSGLTGGNKLIADAVNGALFGAVSSTLAGGDALKGAAWGAAGNALAGTGDTGIFGTLTNEVGGAIAGYGIDKSIGGDGLIGAGMGAFAEHLSEAYEGDKSKTGTKKEASNIEELWGEPEEAGFMEKYGLQNDKGEGTLLGKSLVGGIASYAQSKESESVREDIAKLQEDAYRNRKDLDEEFDQRNLRAFSSKSPLVIRNG